MSAPLILIGIIFAAAFPLIAVYFLFRLAKYKYPLSRYLITVLVGSAAFLPALLLQNILAIPVYYGRVALFYHYFIRIALTEELSRLLMLFIFFWFYKRFKSLSDSNYAIDGKQPPALEVIKIGTAAGLVSGLGFAMFENAVYAASNINLLLLRLVTAALHAACGSRIGAAAVTFRSNPVKAAARVLSAVAIHGIYNLMVTLPGISSIVAVLIALSAFTIAMISITGNSQSAEAPTDY